MVGKIGEWHIKFLLRMKNRRILIPWMLSRVDGNEYIEKLYFPTLDLTLPVIADLDLTLFTCTLSGRTRLTVRCTRK